MSVCDGCKRPEEDRILFVVGRNRTLDSCDHCQAEITREFLSSYGLNLDNLLMKQDLASMADEEYNNWINSVEQLECK